MTSYDWLEERSKAIALFGDQPHAETEQDVLEHFQRSPALVIEEIASVGQSVQSGSVRSGWAVLRKRLGAVDRANVIVSAEPSREKRISQAEQWMRVAGLHFDRWDEVEDELFGDRGKLRSWPELKERMQSLWSEQRVIGELVEREEIERAQERIKLRAKLAEKSSEPETDWIGEEPPIPASAA